MTNCKITLLMNNGKEVIGYHSTEKNNSADVAAELFGKEYHTISGLTNKNKDEAILFRTSDVSVMRIRFIEKG